MSLTDYERETIVNMHDGAAVAYIYTAQRKMITRLKRNPAAVLIEEGAHEETPWARFALPPKLISFRTVAVKQQLTEEQRQERAARLRANGLTRKRAGGQPSVSASSITEQEN